MSTQPLQEFALFPQLPPELRRAIWQQCRPRRVAEVDLPHYLIPPWSYCDGHDTSLLNSRRPIITRICRESRAVAFEGTGSVAECYAKGPIIDLSNPLIRDWISEPTDIIHLNWTEGWDEQGGWCDESPIASFVWLAQHFVAASIIDDTIHGFRAGIVTKDSELYDGPPDDDPAPILDHLALRKDYLVTIETVKLHVSFEQVLESGLFGRLGEECIQLVDPFDKNQIQRYFELWQSGPPSLRGFLTWRFQRHSSMKRLKIGRMRLILHG